MDPMTIVLICTAVFGTVMVLSAFIRQLLLSRDKKLNDEAQSRALAQEASELEKIRVQMLSNTRFDAHYQLLGENKDAIKYLDTQIEEILRKKAEIIDRYAQITLKESGAIINSGEVSSERKCACDKLRIEIDREIAAYDEELKLLQQRRASLWDTNKEFQNYLLAQEKARNANLDHIYKQHSALLEKVYLRHIDNAQAVVIKNIDAGTLSFKDMLMAPIQFLAQFFSGGATAVVPSVALVQTRVEQASRVEVERTEQDINSSPAEDLSAHQEEEELPKERKEPETTTTFAL